MKQKWTTGYLNWNIFKKLWFYSPFKRVLFNLGINRFKTYRSYLFIRKSVIKQMKITETYLERGKAVVEEMNIREGVDPYRDFFHVIGMIVEATMPEWMKAKDPISIQTMSGNKEQAPVYYMDIVKKEEGKL